MKSRFGCSTLGALVSIAALSAVGVAGYSTFTGKTICSVIHGCPDSSTSESTVKTINVADQTSDEKPCCALSKMAKTRKAMQIAGISAKEMCSKTMTVQTRSLNAVVLGATYPVAVPAAFYDSTAALDDSKLVSAGCCSSAKKACSSTATVINASATSEKAAGSCCSSAKKTCASTATVVNASATGEKADAGCCKGSGERADAKACCGKCKSKVAETKSAEPIAEKPATSDQNPS